MRVERHEEHLDVALLLDGQRQRQVAERIELHGHLVADGTDECGLEETVEEVDDDRVVAHLVSFPRFPRNHLQEWQDFNRESL